jgi:hypothetical protein
VAAAPSPEALGDEPAAPLAVGLAVGAGPEEDDEESPLLPTNLLGSRVPQLFLMSLVHAS